MFNSPLISPVDLTLPNLPRQLEGLRIAQVSDLHVRRPKPFHHRVGQHLARLNVDLVLFTGDYMSHSGDEAHSRVVMESLCDRIDARLGMVGVFGNHDSQQVRQMLAHLPIRWLNDSGFVVPGLPLEILGLEAGWLSFGDSLVMLQHLAQTIDQAEHRAPPRHRPELAQRSASSAGHTAIATAPAHAASTGALDDRPKAAAEEPPDRPLRLLLSHYPGFLPVAADLGVDIMFSGHTHGGQVRLPPGRIWTNSTDMPLHLTSGVLRHRAMLCVISRGLGESILPLRLFCPPHIPLYTLRRGPLEGKGGDHVENVRPW